MATVKLKVEKRKKIQSSIFLFEGRELAMTLSDAMEFAGYSKDIANFLKFAQKGTYSLSYSRTGTTIDSRRSFVTQGCLLSIRDSKDRKRALDEKKIDSLTLIIDVFEECRQYFREKSIQSVAKQMATNDVIEVPENHVVNVPTKMLPDEMNVEICCTLNYDNNGDYYYDRQAWNRLYSAFNKVLKDSGTDFNIYNEYNKYLRDGNERIGQINFIEKFHPEYMEILYDIVKSGKY